MPELCEKCDMNKHADGLTVCSLCLVAEKIELERENDKLKAELKQKEAQLSEFQKGLPIGKADKNEAYLCFHYDCHPAKAEWCKDDDSWSYTFNKRVFLLDSGYLFPLPRS